jgi:hypothetical protein
MLRNSLLTAGMFSVLLATSACGTMTADPGSQPPDTAGAGIEANLGGHDKSSDEIGISQRAAAEKAEAAAAARQAREASGAGQAAAAEKAAAAAQKEAQAPNGAPMASPAVHAPAPAAETIVTIASTTAYALREKTPAGGQGRPNGAGGATGTYSDPITVTAGNAKAAAHTGLDVKAGTLIYLPDVRRYFIVDDSCGEGTGPQGSPCRQGDDADDATSTIWIDMWLGGRSMSAEEADNCAARVTEVQAAVLNPASNYAVAPGTGVIHDGICDAGYGNTPVQQ